jgi:hypothetical protein
MLLGKFSHEMMIALGDEATVMKALDGSSEANEAGMTNGEFHVDGTTATAGTETTGYEMLGNEGTDETGVSKIGLLLY